MDIDLLAWLNKRLTTPKMVTRENALPGRATSILNPIPVHAVLGLPLDAVPDGAEVAYFALGCYWGEEQMFWETPGVLNTAVGFMGGFTPNPTYEESCTGQTGHTETVQVVFDPTQVGFDDLLTLFWESHDPTQLNQQGNDIGTHYRSALFPVDEAQQAAAVASLAAFQTRLTEAGYGAITTEITRGKEFYYAELEQQQYLHNNPDGYCPDHATGVSCRRTPPRPVNDEAGSQS